MINAKYVDGLELRIKGLSKKLSDESNSALHLIAENKSLKAERDALAAQVGRLTPLARRCIWGALVWNDHNFGDLRGYLKEETHKAGILDIDEANEFLAATPQHHLRQVRADAGRAGFIEGVEWFLYNSDESTTKAIAADNYHASILAGKE